MTGGWGAAFQKAVEIAEAGEDEDIKRMARKRHLHASNSNEEDDEECGGFKQPKRLAKYALGLVEDIAAAEEEKTVVATVPNSSEDKPSSQSVVESEDHNNSHHTSEKRLLSLEERCARQLCRAWLKHHYLGLGQPCSEDPCPRMHKITCKPEKLYKDYSFKGLNPNQKKTIIEKVKLEQELESKAQE